MRSTYRQIKPEFRGCCIRCHPECGCIHSVRGAGRYGKRTGNDWRKRKTKLAKELARSNGMLNNEKFLSKAPQAKVDEEKAKLEKYKQMMEDVENRLAQLK